MCHLKQKAVAATCAVPDLISCCTANDLNIAATDLCCAKPYPTEAAATSGSPFDDIGLCLTSLNELVIAADISTAPHPLPTVSINVI